MTEQTPCPSPNTNESCIAAVKTSFLSRKERRRRGAGELSRLNRSDFVLFSPGNSGRTWLRVMITRAIELYYGLEIGPAIRFDNRHKLDPRVPKIAVTHNRWLPYYKKARDLAECKQYYHSTVLILVRNPLDTCVSQYFQWLHRSKEDNIRLKGWPARDSGLSLQDFLNHPDTGVERLCRELNMWLRESEKINSALVVRYEDIRQSPAVVLKKIISFFGISTSTKMIEEAVEFSSFENMRQREAISKQAPSADKKKEIESEAADAFKSRRGKISGYSNYLSSQECAYFEQVIKSNLASAFGYSELPDVLPMTYPSDTTLEIQ
jgi:hypothetical protein